uniref:CBM6 domain-containing protein n=1 Tax=Cystobacter fuscus TaxID=43 RepID=A0A3Q8I3J0_9BACT|nr:hypothetical protein [Cystobacter fuscus]
MKLLPASLCFMLPLLSATPVLAQNAPATWTEHWFEHNQTVSRVYQDNDVAIYFDPDVNRSITWPNSFVRDVWKYTKKTYGHFGSDMQLYAIFHTGKYGGGHPSTYFDSDHDYRNVIDVGSGSTTAWTSGTGWDLDIVTHEISHIVEFASKGVQGSPAFNRWGDSKWAEIFIYDVYLALGRTSDATRVYNDVINKTDSFPRANTHWFRDWFYPIYKNHGGASVLNRFFVLLAQYFPRNGQDYAREMNWGEFVHFWSGAAGVNLKTQATSAFGWPAEWETQFVQAQRDFPFTYTKPGPTAVSVFQDLNHGGYGAALPVGRYTLSALNAWGVRNDDISSLKVASGYQVTLYADDNFAGATLTKTADDASLIDDDWNDKVSSLVVSQGPSVPGTLIQAEAYSSMSGVSTESTSDSGGGSNVGHIDTADWLAYNGIQFPSSGTYKVEYRVASPSGGRLSLDLNAGATVLGTLDIPATGDWQSWTTISHTVTVTAGTYNVGIYAQAGGWNFNWFRITRL